MSLFECGIPGVKYIFLFIAILMLPLQLFARIFIPSFNYLISPEITYYISGLSILTGGNIFFFSLFSGTTVVDKPKEQPLSLPFRFLISLLPGIFKALANIIKLFYSLILSYQIVTLTPTQISIHSTIQIIGFISIIPIFNYLICGKKIYKHHIISLVIILINILVISISGTIFTLNDIKSNANTDDSSDTNKYTLTFYLLSILMLLYSALFDISLIIQKYEIDFLFYNPFYIQLMTGIGYLLIYVPFIYIGKTFSSFPDFFIVEIGIKDLILSFVLECVIYTLHIKVLSDLTPMHLVFVVIWEYSFTLIFMFEGKQSIIYRGICIVCFILIVSGFLLYTESVIVKVFGLDFNTEKNIKLRGESEKFDNLEEIKDISFAEKKKDIVIGEEEG